MRKLALAAVLFVPLLAGCQTGSGGLGAVASAVPDITNNLSLACKSAVGLEALAQSSGSARFAATATKLQTATATFCDRAIADAPTIAKALTTINTTAATLLGLGVAL